MFPTSKDKQSYGNKKRSAKHSFFMSIKYVVNYFLIRPLAIESALASESATIPA